MGVRIDPGGGGGGGGGTLSSYFEIDGAVEIEMLYKDITLG